MHNDVYNYVKRFHTCAKHEMHYMDEQYGVNIASTEFVKNWTINFHDSACGNDYRLADGTSILSARLQELVQKDADKGFFIRRAAKSSTHYALTELGQNYILFKMEL